MPFSIDENLALNELSDPIKKSSKFYGLYYLREIKDIEQLEIDLEMYTVNLSNAFYHYGFYTIINELTNFNRIGLGFWKDGEHYGFGHIISVDDPEDYLYNQLNLHVENVTEAVSLYMDLIELANKVLDDESFSGDAKEIIYEANRSIDMLVNPKKFLRISSEVFSDVDWKNSYGGESWADICRALLRKGEMSNITFVDSMWALEHNSRNWIDKIPNPGDRVYYQRAIEMMDNPKERLPTTLYKLGGRYRYSPIALEYILDIKREGELGKIWGFIVQSDKKLFSQYKQILKQAGM